MSIFAISDLHLPFGANKPMDIFNGWENYTAKIESRWKNLVGENDTVVIPGDISWALKLEDAKPDFDFINKLSGKKIILKGNHDLWWSTASKVRNYFKDNNFESLSIVFNDAVLADGVAICGTRGWLYDGTGEKDTKVILRECGRLDASINKAKSVSNEIAVFMHYPPVYGDFICEEIIDVLKSHDIKDVYYGHIHGKGFNKSVKNYGDINMHLVSCDCVDFTPVLVKNNKF